MILLGRILSTVAFFCLQSFMVFLLIIPKHLDYILYIENSSLSLHTLMLLGCTMLRSITKIRLTNNGDTTLMAESEEELKSLLMKVKQESEKAGLKLSIQKTNPGFWPHHFMEDRWETMEKVTDFLFLGSKITVDGDCSHEIKRCLFLGRKAMTNLDSILKSRISRRKEIIKIRAETNEKGMRETIVKLNKTLKAGSLRR